MIFRNADGTKTSHSTTQLRNALPRRRKKCRRWSHGSFTGDSRPTLPSRPLSKIELDWRRAREVVNYVAVADVARRSIPTSQVQSRADCFRACMALYEDVRYSERGTCSATP